MFLRAGNIFEEFSLLLLSSGLSIARMSSKVRFSDYSGDLESVPSDWNDVELTETSCQTDASLYQFNEQETQTGIATEIVGDEVKAKYTGMSVLDFMSKKHKRMSKDKWQSSIEGGKVTVTNAEECAVQTNPQSKIAGDYFIEYVNVSSEAGTQTTPPVAATDEQLPEGKAPTSTSASGGGNGDSKNSGDYDEYDDDFGEGKAGGESKSGESKNSGDTALAYASFLDEVYPLVEEALLENNSSTAFDGYESRLSGGDMDDSEVKYWEGLSVDLEKKKVVYPDWSKAKHQSARVVRQILTRNRERVYDIEFDDSFKMNNVREEHLRIRGENQSSLGARGGRDKQQTLQSLQDGVRVHCMVKQGKGGRGAVRGLSGRIVKCHRGDVFDVECEGGNVQRDVPADELAVGLVEGQTIEARRPTTVQLQGTGVSWNASGTSLAVSYGLDNITGWCDSPGALCVWNIFGRSFNKSEPDFTMSHPCCLMSVAFHPMFPSIVAAGSFNGEVVVWDLNFPDQAPTVSPIADYSHKEPISALHWVKEGITASSGEDTWLLASAGADGRVLFWTLDNGFLHPIKGGVIAKPQKSSRRTYPAAYGATALAFSGGMGSSARPQWMVAGTETGSLCRSQTARMFSSPSLSMDSFQTGQRDKDTDIEKGDGVYAPIKRGNEAFAHESHVGSVHSIDFSPFSRNIFLSCGSDGTLRLSHLLESSPLRIWEPAPAQSTTEATSEPFCPLTGAQFSPTRPMVFATASATGYIYVFDLALRATGPVAALEVPIKPENVAAEGNGSRSRRKRGDIHRRVGFSGMAFNRKQRGMLAACDYEGNVHIWRLGWGFSSKQPEELALLEAMESGGVGRGEEFSFE